MPADPLFPSSGPEHRSPEDGQPGSPAEDVELDFDSGGMTGPAAARVERRTFHRPAAPAEPRPETATPFESNPEMTISGGPAPDGKGVRGKGAPLEKKTGAGTKPFTRVVTRPETTVAANLASDQTPAERTISPLEATGPPAFGKIRHQQELDYRPSRLQNVMEETWIHSRLGWLDHLGRVRVIFLSIILTGIVAVILWPYLKEVFRERRIVAESAAPATPLPSDAVRQAGIRRAFDAYLAAREIPEKLRWVIEPERIESRMKNFYLTQGQKDPAVITYEVSPPIRAGAEWWFILTCPSEAGSPAKIPMKETPEGGQLDWENFVAYGSMPWDQFQTSRPVEPQSLRLRIRRSSTFSGKFQAGEYLAFDLSHRSGPPLLRGYALKDSRCGQLLAAEAGFQDWKAVNLYLAWDGPDAVVISDLIRNNWLDGLTGDGMFPLK